MSEHTTVLCLVSAVLVGGFFAYHSLADKLSSIELDLRDATLESKERAESIHKHINAIGHLIRHTHPHDPETSSSPSKHS